ncbi:dihydroorotase [Candidatus Protochlamydia phocaeensis]|uniref:dihydroorotase n=1 Tax=Candidatus Protochlamydia phocaeensis TaxID=1414722 RepID=UPI000838CA05|nr:dihydroorotase family protein [Candidatus Protochlamydia phocaeensis]
MITIKNAKTLAGEQRDFTLPSSKDYSIDAKGQLLFLPGLIDSHISLGPTTREDWKIGIESAIRGGVTTLIDIPRLDQSCYSKVGIEEHKQIVHKHLSDWDIPLHYNLYATAHPDHLEELGLAKKLIRGLAILIDPVHREQWDDEKFWERAFQLAAWEDLPVIVNTQDEDSWQKLRKKEESLLEKAIFYTEQNNTRLYVLNVATREEIELIQQARERSLLIYAETTPRHLFLNKSSQTEHVWEALNRGTIEMIGSGFFAGMNHSDRILLEEGNFSYSDPIFLLPLLLTASFEKKISIEKILGLTRFNINQLFNLDNQDAVLVDVEHERAVQQITNGQTIDIKLRGWPVYTFVKGKVFKIPPKGYHLIPE